MSIIEHKHSYAIELLSQTLDKLLELRSKKQIRSMKPDLPYAVYIDKHGTALLLNRFYAPLGLPASQGHDRYDYNDPAYDNLRVPLLSIEARSLDGLSIGTHCLVTSLQLSEVLAYPTKTNRKVLVGFYRKLFRIGDQVGKYQAAA